MISNFILENNLVFNILNRFKKRKKMKLKLIFALMFCNTIAYPMKKSAVNQNDKALEAYNLVSNWRSLAAKDKDYYSKITDQLDQLYKSACDSQDLLALEVCPVMKMYFNQGGSPFEWAIAGNKERAIQFLVTKTEEKPSASDIKHALILGKIETAKAFILSGRVITDHCGCVTAQPVTNALDEGAEHLFWLLMKAGAQLQKKHDDCDGFTSIQSTIFEYFNRLQKMHPREVKYKRAVQLLEEAAKQPAQSLQDVSNLDALLEKARDERHRINAEKERIM